MPILAFFGHLSHARLFVKARLSLKVQSKLVLKNVICLYLVMAKSRVDVYSKWQLGGESSLSCVVHAFSSISVRL